MSIPCRLRAPSAGLLVAALLLSTLACPGPRVRDEVGERLTAIATATAAGDVESAQAAIEAPWPEPAEPLVAAQRARVVGEGVFGLGSDAWSAAADLFELALGWRRAVAEDDFEVAELLSDLASVRYYEGDWNAAERLDREALGLRVALLGETSLEVALDRRRLGTTLYKQGRLREAAELLELAVEARRGSDPVDPIQLALDLNAVGEVRRAEGRLAEGRALLAEALALAVGAGDPDTEAWIRGNLGLLDKDEGRFDDALAHLDRALEIARSGEPPDPYWIALAQQNRGEALREARRLEEAAAAMSEALAMARAAFGQSGPELGSFLSQSAALAAAEDDLDRADAGWSEALGVLDQAVESDHPLRAQTLHDLGSFRCRVGRTAEGEAALRDALEARRQRFGTEHPDTATTLSRLARCVAEDAGRRDEALALVRAALEVFAASSAYPEEEAEALALESELLVDRGLLLEAIERLRRAVEIVERQRAISGGGDAARAERFARWAERYRRLVALELDAGDLAGAFEIAERMRARVFLEQLAAGRVDLRAGIAPAVLRPLEEDERRITALVAEIQGRAAFEAERGDLEPAERRRRLASLGQELAAATHELGRLAEAIRRESPLWRDIVTTGGQVLDLATARAEVIPSDALLLVYQLGQQESRLLAVPAAGAGEPAAFTLELDEAGAAALEVTPGPLSAELVAGLLLASGQGAPELVAGTRALVKVAPPGARLVAGAPARLHALWRALVPAALRPQVERAREVVVVSDGALHRLPLEALVVGLGARPRYWLDVGPRVRYAASATVLANLGRRGDATAASAPQGSSGLAALVVADPLFGAAPAALRASGVAGPLPALPGTAREAAAISAALAPGLGEGLAVLEGERASEGAVRQALAEPRDILHFATHGLVDEEQAELLASLALTPGDPLAGHRDDGYLQLFEIYGLHLDAQLAVLSACDSDVGREIAGEGVFALSRGFLAAGAQRVVASEWPVDDAATAALMAAFYQRLADDLAAGRDPDWGGALVSARRAVRARPEWSSPVYWAPFVLSGAR